jgi:hypothetical protein
MNEFTEDEKSRIQEQIDSAQQNLEAGYAEGLYQDAKDLLSLSKELMEK